MSAPISDPEEPRSAVDDPAEPPQPRLGPVTESERIHTIDVLRGIALLGVVIANVWLWFSGLAFRFPGYREELLRLSLDSVVHHSISVLVSGKAISTFSFLFGLGFGVQMLRAGERGVSIAPIYSRRLAVLLAIGLLHMTLLWYGDILTVYAALGFILLLFRHRRDRTLLIWAAVLLLAVPLLLSAIPWLMGLFGAAPPKPDLAKIAARNAATLSVLQSGGYTDILRENLHQAGKFYLGRKAVWVLFMLGLFLAGLWAGRRRIFENVAANRALFRRIAAWGLPIGLVGNLTLFVLTIRISPAVMLERPRLMLAVGLISVFAIVPLAAGYVSGLTLLLERAQWRRRLSVFAPVGRMALTNYLAQTGICLLIFYPYGGGLIGRSGPALGLAVALLLFAVQMVWSPIWLSYFRFGPMEWLWRLLTYGKAQPMRRHRAAAAVAPAPSG